MLDNFLLFILRCLCNFNDDLHVLHENEDHILSLSCEVPQSLNNEGTCITDRISWLMASL